MNTDRYRPAMRWAYEVATKSPDISNQNGAVTLSPGTDRIIEPGYNHFYNGIPHNVEDRDIKLQGIEHAERDCIYQTGRLYGTQDCIMVCPWSACHECARAIIGSGISSLVVHRERQELTPERWRDNVHTALGWIKANMPVIEVCGPIIGAPSLIVNGRLWSPERLTFDD